MRTRHYMKLSLIGMLLAGTIPFAAAGDFAGRFDLGSYSMFYDDDDLDDRSTFYGKLRLDWLPGSTGDWNLYSNLRIRGETDGEDGRKLQVWDLRFGYGLDEKPIAGAVGLMSLHQVSGIGSVIGAHLQTNPCNYFQGGIFGGGNAVVEEGITRSDGTRMGGYLKFLIPDHGDIGIAYVSIADTDCPCEEQDLVVFNSQLNFNDQLFLYQTGEYHLASDTDDTGRLTYYYGNMRYDIHEMVAFSVTYDRYDRLPAMLFKPDPLDEPNVPFDEIYRFQSHKGYGIAPRIDLKFARTWRLFVRYRLKDTDNFRSDRWNQYLVGIASGNLFNSGISLSGTMAVNRGEYQDYETGYISLCREFGSKLSLSLTFVKDRFVSAENILTARHVESTQRAGISAHYRISRSMNLFMEYEQTFADDPDDEDQRLLFNYQIRL